jgi:hypothetical protein
MQSGQETVPMNLQRTLKDMLHNARTFGPAPALADLEYRALKKFFSVRIWKGMTALLEEVDQGLLDNGGFDVRHATPDELRSAGPEWTCEMPPAFLDSALSQGHECVGCFDGKKLASIGWYSRTPTPASDSLLLEFDPAWAYMYKGFTLDAYRGKRLHGIGMSYALRHYTERGARGLISFVEFNNLKSLRSVEKMGYRVFGSIYVARVRGRDLTWSSPGCRPYRFGARPGHFPGW